MTSEALQNPYFVAILYMNIDISNYNIVKIGHLIKLKLYGY